MKCYILFFLVFVQAAVGQPIALFAPDSLADRFGAASSDVPFNRYNLCSPDVNLSMRYQQVISLPGFSERGKTSIDDVLTLCF